MSGKGQKGISKDMSSNSLQAHDSAMNKQMLQRQVQGSRLVDHYGKFETLAALLDENPRSLKLEALFSTRSSGWTGAAAFHTACDHKGPTLVLIECQDGASYGGYTSINWTSSNSYQSDTKAFLFRIANFTSCHKKQASQKFANNGLGNEIFSSSGYGPTFGGGNDLLTFTSSAGLKLSCNESSYSTSGPLIPTTVSRDHSSCNMEVSCRLHGHLVCNSAWQLTKLSITHF